MTRGRPQVCACQACLLTGGLELIMGTTMGCVLTELKAEMKIKFENPELTGFSEQCSHVARRTMVSSDCKQFSQVKMWHEF